MNRSLVLRNQTVLLFLGILVLGLVALLIGSAMQYETRAMYGIAIGTLPAGVLGAVLSVWALRHAKRRHPERLRAESDERILQIRLHAGNTAFWAAYTLLFLYTILSPLPWVRSISPTLLGCSTLVFLGLVHAVASIIYNRMY